jgi:hypothetical protein
VPLNLTAQNRLGVFMMISNFQFRLWYLYPKIVYLNIPTQSRKKPISSRTPAVVRKSGILMAH